VVQHLLSSWYPSRYLRLPRCQLMVPLLIRYWYGFVPPYVWIRDHCCWFDFIPDLRCQCHQMCHDQWSCQWSWSLGCLIPCRQIIRTWRSSSRKHHWLSLPILLHLPTRCEKRQGYAQNRCLFRCFSRSSRVPTLQRNLRPVQLLNIFVNWTNQIRL